LKYGPKFRDFSPGNPLVILKESLHAFIEDICAFTEGYDRSQFLAWKAEVINETQKRLKALPNITLPEPLLNKSKNTLRSLTNTLVLVPADKAANNIILVCKRLYTHILRQELMSTSSAYTQESRLKDEIIQEHRLFLNKWQLPCVDQLPSLSALPKMHKPKMAFRYISGAGHCSCKIASQILGKLLACVDDSLRKKNDEILINTGVRRYFIIRDGYEVSDFLARWNRSGHKSRDTFDFSTLYTALPLDDLCNRIRQVILEARDSLPEAKYSWKIKVDPHAKGIQGASWVDVKNSVHSTRTQIFSIGEFFELLVFVIHNAFVINGGIILRQICGIPMGTNSAPLLANLFLYYYESTYMDTLRETDLEKARVFHLTFRLIDDVLSCDNPFASLFKTPKEEGGIYPAFLTCNQTNTEISHTNFCGIKIEDDGNKFRTSIYNKKDDFSFEVRSYPHLDSNIPESIAYSAFMGQLHRFYRICNSYLPFLDSVTDMATKLILLNGCLANKLTKRFSKFIRKISWKFSVKKTVMMRWFDTAVHTAKSSCNKSPSSDSMDLSLNDFSYGKKRRTYKKPTKLDLLKYEPNLPTTIITSRTELLSDVKIANVGYEIFKAFQRQHSLFRVEWVYPRTEHLFVQNCKDLAREITRALFTEGVTFYVLNIGSCHWVLLLIDSRQGKEYFFYFDPLGHPCSRLLKSTLQNLCPYFTFKDNRIRIQFDSFQCGVWACWIAETILDHFTVDVAVSNIPWLELISTNVMTRATDHTSFIANTRDRYYTTLTSSLSHGNLGWMPGS